MDVITDSEPSSDSDALNVDSAVNVKEDFATDFNLSVDEAVKKELDRLFEEEGVTASCKKRCFYCCGQNILISIEEAQALTQFIKQEFSREQIEELKERTKLWHGWNKTRQSRQHFAEIKHSLSELNILYCPLLVDGKCSAYEMRPLICRTHFVSTDPQACRPFNDPESIEDKAIALTSVLKATRFLSNRLKKHTENAGLNFSGSLMLLPHWLAIEMNWDFAIELIFE